VEEFVELVGVVSPILVKRRYLYLRADDTVDF